jgi:tripartite ATP-independent transporter DctM subunit
MVMGTIYLGVATPTEAAALGCFISLVLAALFRNLTWQILKNALLSGVKVTSFVMLIVVGAQALSMGLSFLEVPARLVYITTSFSSNPLVILAMVTLLYIILGMFIEATSMLLLTLPLVYPILKALGFNSIWLGVYFVIMVEMAQITPPVGINLYVIHGIAERKYMGDIMWGIVPFFFCQLALIVLIIAFPDLVLWLPAQMVRKF